MFERTADVNLLILAAVLALVVPVAFVVLFAIAAMRRNGGIRVGGRLTAAVTFTGGSSVGSLLLLGSDPILAAPLIVTAAVVIARTWRAGRRVVAGWFTAGVGLPLGVIWGAVWLGPAQNGSVEDPAPLAWAAVGAILLVAGLVTVVRGDPPALPADPAAPPGQPGSRVFGNVGEAIRAATRIGPFGLPEMALLVGVILTALVVPFLLPPSLPQLAQLAIQAVAVAVVGTEAYVRGWVGPGRRAFEAFSWLGEWELARAREATGRAVPTTKSGAEAWLARQPPDPPDVPIRIELLLFVGRVEAARDLLASVPTTTPEQAFDAAALADLVDWHAGGPGDLVAMEEAAARIVPADGDDRLRAEVAVAAAKVRRRMAAESAAPVDVLQPLLEVRERLGHRADGQVGRAMRHRLLPLLLIVGSVLTLGGTLLGGTLELLVTPLP